MSRASAFLAAMLVLLASAAVAEAQRELRIVNGEPLIAPATAPWSVLIDVVDGSCSGTLIDLSRVLTSATCVFTGEKLLGAQDFTAFAGIVRSGPGTDLSTAQARSVSAVRVHPAYGISRYALAGRGAEGNKSFAYDLALLTLSQPLQPTAQVSPIALAGAPPRARSIVSIFGWGLPRFGVEDEFPLARSMTARTTRPAVCADGHPSLLCTVSKNRTPCLGDNGAGVVTAARTLVGIHSFQDGKCVAGVSSGAISTTDPGVALWLAGRPNPPLAPSTPDLPTIRLAGRRQQQMVCRGPRWRGAGRVRTAFVDLANQRTLQFGPRMFRPTGRDRRRKVYCASVATNAGGVTESSSTRWVRVQVR